MAVKTEDDGSLCVSAPHLVPVLDFEAHLSQLGVHTSGGSLFLQPIMHHHLASEAFRGHTYIHTYVRTYVRTCTHGCYIHEHICVRMYDYTVQVCVDVCTEQGSPRV